MPAGWDFPHEARLGEANALGLTADLREALLAWWLVHRRRANTPNWDVTATCLIDGKAGLLLVEAKAHHGELRSAMGAKPPGNAANHERIASAVSDANAGLDATLPGWRLSTHSHYQLSNRFAWAWKLASLGVPVVLVYLGFLHAGEMATSASPTFETDADWRSTVLAHAGGYVPNQAWDQKIRIAGTSIIPLIRSLRLDLAG